MNDTAPDDRYSDERATFGERLAAAREAADLSQKSLAKRLGVKTKTLAHWEDDLSEPRANRLQTLAGLLNVSLMWLLNGEGDGLPDHADEAPLDPEARLALRQVRELRRDVDNTASRLARLEKNLKRILEAGEA
jgi:transcriptional regulator with XRE-family HTH domain